VDVDRIILNIEINLYKSLVKQYGFALAVYSDNAFDWGIINETIERSEYKMVSN